MALDHRRSRKDSQSAQGARLGGPRESFSQENVSDSRDRPSSAPRHGRGMVVYGDRSSDRGTAVGLTLNPIRRHRESCRRARQSMSAYLDGDLDSSAEARVRRHLTWCPNCGRMLANLSRVVVGLGRLRATPLPDEPAPDRSDL